MTLDEAIKHAEEAAEKNEKKAKSYPRPDRSVRGSGRKYNDCIECASEHRRLAEWLKELKQLREQEPKWIPVSERLPEEWESVLVCLKTKGGMAQAVSERFEGDRWTALCGMKPIAWMPLPEPYKAESEG